MKKILWTVLAVCIVLLPLVVPSPAHATETSGTETGREARPEASEDVMRILVLGCDRTAHLTDSILIVTLDRGNGALSVLQIPRDTYAAYTNRDYRKLNGALNRLGEVGFKDFCASTLGVPLHRFVILNLDAFARVVDSVGGVDVTVPQDMIYSDPAQGLEIRLAAGQAHLNGKQAEHFVRFRSGYADADLGRLEAQKSFLRGFFERCRTLGAMELFRISCSLLTDVQTDLTPLEVRSLLCSIRNSDINEIPMGTFAGQAARGTSGAWYYCINREGAVRMVREFLLPPADYDDSAFDPQRVFDRAENDAFHRIYEAAEGDLPLG